MYGKLFASTFAGSMVGAGPTIFAVWSYVVAQTHKGVVELHPTVLAAVIGHVTPEEIQSAIDYLCSPDPRSRSDAEEGRRLVREGAYQYRVVNHEAYRSIRDEDDRRAYNRRKQRESRARRQSVSLTVNDGQSMSTVSAHTETETETETELTKSDPRDGSDSDSPEGRDDPDELRVLWRYYREQRGRAIPGARELALTGDRRRALRALLRAGYTPDDVRAVIDAYAAQAKHDHALRRWMNGTTEFRPANFGRVLGQLAATGGDLARGAVLPPEVAAWAAEVEHG